MEKKVSMMPHLEDPERFAAFEKATKDKERALYGCFMAAKALSPYLGILSEVHYQEEGLVELLRDLEDAVRDANEAIDRSLPKTTMYDPSPGSAMEPLDIYTLGAQPALCPVCNSRYEEEQIPQEDGAYVGHCCCTRCNHRFIVEEAILRNYWLINHRTKQYTPMHNIENDFFDGDWKEKTPFATEDYIDLDCKTVWPDQKANEYLFYSYDLCRDGMLVGVFYDEDRISKEEVNAFVSTLRRKQDVAFLRNYSLKLYTQKGK